MYCYEPRPIVSDTEQRNNITKLLLAAVLLLCASCVPVPLPEPEHRSLPEISESSIRPQYCIVFAGDDEFRTLGSQWTLLILPLTSIELDRPKAWFESALARSAALSGASVAFEDCNQRHAYELSDFEVHLSAYDLLVTRVVRASASVVVTHSGGVKRKVTAASTKLMLFPFPKLLARELSAVLGTLSDRVLALGLPERAS